MSPQEGEISIEKRAPKGRAGVTEHDASLHSGSTDSAQNSEAKLQNFEAQKRDLKVSH